MPNPKHPMRNPQVAQGIVNLWTNGLDGVTSQQRVNNHPMVTGGQYVPKKRQAPPKPPKGTVGNPIGSTQITLGDIYDQSAMQQHQQRIQEWMNQSKALPPAVSPLLNERKPLIQTDTNQTNTQPMNWLNKPNY